MTVLTENSQSPNNTASHLPEIPKGFKLLRTARIIMNPLGYLEERYQQYGDIFSQEFSSFPRQVIISNPQGIQEIFTADPKLFQSGAGNQIALPLVGANSLLLLDGDRHFQQRKLLMPPLHGERMKTYGKIIRDTTEKVIHNWTPGSTFKAQAQMQEISLEVILHAVFGLSEGERYREIQQIIVKMLDVFSNPLSATFLFFKSLQKDLGAWSPWGRFLAGRQRLDELLYQEIRERQARVQLLGEDILSLLISARDEAGEPMSEVELRDELMTMLFAGHETTATALSWALYWIHYVPEVRENLLQELSTIDAENADAIEITKLPYLNAVCSETLRFYPIIFFAFPRILQAPMQLMGYNIPKGIMLSPCIYLVHHREDIYPEPKRFKPERFLERQFSPYEYFPFGGGNRRCIGAAFAMFEMKLVLAKILSRYSLELAEKGPVAAVRRGLTIAPRGGVRLRVTG
ncbi:MAG: cytochrome P450 [Oscillatoriaceae cyanobacterium Prado104]|jgi:cytochrome P450|nr:cytochrome P450 [Oscillatoriaceae cyanobacterium Prado104]